MRLWIVALITASVALPLAACERDVAEKESAAETKPVLETPKRKPGLWKQSMSIEGIDVVQTANVCLDEEADAKLAWWAQQGVRVGCAKNDIGRQPDGSWTFSSTCEMVGGIKMTTTGSAVGDFQNRFQVKAETTTTGAPTPQMNGTRATTIDNTWLGECPAGMKPGEMELPDGRRVDMLAMADGAAPAP